MIRFKGQDKIYGEVNNPNTILFRNAQEGNRLYPVTGYGNKGIYQMNILPNSLVIVNRSAVSGEYEVTSILLTAASSRNTVIGTNATGKVVTIDWSDKL